MDDAGFAFGTTLVLHSEVFVPRFPVTDQGLQSVDC